MTERRRLHRRLIVDITPLRESPRFRILYLAQLLASIGRQITVVAVPYQVYILTESTLAVGALGIAQLIPLMVVSIIGGAVADAFDRRVLLVAGHLLLALTAVGLGFNASLAERDQRRLHRFQQPGPDGGDPCPAQKRADRPRIRPQLDDA
jgi:MFS family permease